MPKNFKARVSQTRKLQRRSLTQFYFSTHTKKKKGRASIRTNRLPPTNFGLEGTEREFVAQ